MMPLSEILFVAVALYVLYRFIFNFIVPVARTTRQVRQQFRNMQDMHNNQQPNSSQGPFAGPNYGSQGPTQARPAQPEAKKPSSNGKGGEYIDFEEVK